MTITQTVNGQLTPQHARELERVQNLAPGTVITPARHPAGHISTVPIDDIPLPHASARAYPLILALKSVRPGEALRIEPFEYDVKNVYASLLNFCQRHGGLRVRKRGKVIFLWLDHQIKLPRNPR